MMVEVDEHFMPHRFQERGSDLLPLSGKLFVASAAAKLEFHRTRIYDIMCRSSDDTSMSGVFC